MPQKMEFVVFDDRFWRKADVLSYRYLGSQDEAGLRRAVVKRIHDWSQSNVDGGFSADIRWKKSDGRLLGQMIDRSRMEKIVQYIGSTADEQTVPTTVRGMLVGWNVSSRSFHIAEPQGENYLGHVSPEAILPDEMTLGRMYEAEIDVS